MLTHIGAMLLIVKTLEALGKTDDAVAVFREDPQRRKFRAYLKRLPDFADFEAEQKAFEIAAKHRSVDTALCFFIA